jgi:mono/diheme cytochrome c family protein
MVPRAMLIAGVVIFWVLLGLVVFFVAMWGGPRRAREALYSEHRSGRAALYVAIVASFGFGLVVPALVLAFNGEHKASVGPGGVHLTPAQQKGRRLFAETCAFCHTLGGANAAGRTGPNLDELIPQASSGIAKNGEAFVLSSIESGFAGHYGQMPAGLFQGREAQDVASFVAAVAGQH